MKTERNSNEYMGFPGRYSEYCSRSGQNHPAKAMPAAEAVISYGIAGYRHQGMFVFSPPIRKPGPFYPALRQASAFKKNWPATRREGYGAVFPDKPVDLDLIDGLPVFAWPKRKRLQLKNGESQSKKPAKKPFEKKYRVSNR